MKTNFLYSDSIGRIGCVNQTSSLLVPDQTMAAGENKKEIQKTKRKRGMARYNTDSVICCSDKANWNCRLFSVLLSSVP